MKTPIKIKQRWIKTNQQQHDLMLACAAVLLVYAGAVHVEMAEHLTAWLSHFEFMQLDELPITLFAAALACAWFSHRRMREISAEMQRRSLAEEASRHSRQMFQMLFEAGLSGNFVCNMQGDIVLCNQAFKSMSGIASHQTHRENLDLKSAMGHAWHTLQAQLQLNGTLDIAELSLNHPDGRAWIVMARFTLAQADTAVAREDYPQQDYSQENLPKQSPSQAILHKEIHGYFIDITEQTLAEKELGQLLNENQALARNAMQVQEEERRYLAREIHDDMGQYLTAIRLDAAALMVKDKVCKDDNVFKNKASEENANAVSAERYAERISQHAEHIQLAIKALIGRLRPAALDEFGLITALQQLVTEWKQQHVELHCQLELDEHCNPPEPVSIVAYRMVQESLTNIARHAQARHISIHLSQLEHAGQHQLQLTIMDDGIGLTKALTKALTKVLADTLTSAPANAKAENPAVSGNHDSFTQIPSSKGFGLVGMRERVEAAGGKFSIQNRVSGGLMLAAIIPFEPVIRQQPTSAATPYFSPTWCEAGNSANTKSEVAKSEYRQEVQYGL